MKYRFFKHTADIKFRAYGSNLNKVFENSTLAMFASMYKGKVKGIKTKKLSVKGKDLENLLYGFLEDLLVLLDSKNFFVSKLKIQVTKSIRGYSLKAELFGDDAGNYEIGTIVKAITYNDMFVKKLKNQYVAQVVLDV